MQKKQCFILGRHKVVSAVMRVHINAPLEAFVVLRVIGYSFDGN